MSLLKHDKFIFKIFISIAIILSIGLTFIADSQTVLAQEAVNFSVKPIQSDKQINRGVSYFDLLLSPGEEYILEVDIFNNDENPMDASVTACTAGTNSGGVIEYDNINVSDDSLKVPFADVATVEEPLISVPALGKSRARIKIKMPDTLFDGIMLGGIVVKKVNLPDDSPSSCGTSILNEYCYAIAVQICVNNNKVEPEFRLRNVEPTLSNYKTTIAANLQNYQAALAKDIKIDANIYYNNGSKPLYTNSSTDFDVAPNSNFDYLIPCAGKLAAGEYRLELTAALDDRVWEFDETFTITAPEANSINEQSLDKPGINYYFYITLLLLVILLVMIVWLIIAKRRKKKG